MQVVIVGAGDLGSSLARTLSDMGHRITVIEKTPQAVSRLPQGRVESGAITLVHRDGSTGAAMIEAGLVGDADQVPKLIGEIKAALLR